MITYTACTYVFTYKDEDDKLNTFNAELIDFNNESITAAITASPEKKNNGGKFRIGRYGSFTWLVDMKNHALMELDDPYDIEDLYYQLDDLPVTCDRAEELTIIIYYLVTTLWDKNNKKCNSKDEAYQVMHEMRKPYDVHSTLFR